MGALVNPDIALHMLGETFWTGLLVCAPVLGSVLLVGLIVSVFQVVTQIQDMSLTFIPKLVTAILVLTTIGAWMLREMAQFSSRLWTSIPSLF
ncbi:flagellar biosynthetic protein FliQ [Burkholderia theae]|uniref:flagellar biosynthetic protein FliQ n=1 Tax=Burkholderia theae TaxID=3143496 RepID=UPI003AFA1C3A